MFAYLLFLTTAMIDPPRTVQPSSDQIAEWCSDRKVSNLNMRCAPQDHLIVITAQPASLPVPMPDRSQRARPKNNPGSWVLTNDYPVVALRNEEEGLVDFRLTIGADGRVSGCDVTRSSGSAALDEATCSIISVRAVFEPARDVNGKATTGSYANRVRWIIPTESSYAFPLDAYRSGAMPRFGTYIQIDEGDYPPKALESGMQGTATVGLTLSARGKVTGCDIESSSGYALLDAKSCDIARGWRFIATAGASKITAETKTRHRFRWILPYAWQEYQRTGIYPPKSY